MISELFSISFPWCQEKKPFCWICKGTWTKALDCDSKSKFYSCWSHGFRSSITWNFLPFFVICSLLFQGSNYLSRVLLPFSYIILQLIKDSFIKEAPQLFPVSEFPNLFRCPILLVCLYQVARDTRTQFISWSDILKGSTPPVGHKQALTTSSKKAEIRNQRVKSGTPGPDIRLFLHSSIFSTMMFMLESI